MGENYFDPPMVRGSYVGTTPGERKTDELLGLALSFVRDLCAELEGMREPVFREAASALRTWAIGAGNQASLMPTDGESELKLMQVRGFVNKFAKGIMHEAQYFEIQSQLNMFESQMCSGETAQAGIDGINALWDSLKRYLWESSSLNPRPKPDMRKNSWGSNIAKAALDHATTLRHGQRKTTAASERKNSHATPPANSNTALKQSVPSAPPAQSIPADMQTAPATDNHVPNVVLTDTLPLPKPEGSGYVPVQAIHPMAEDIQSGMPRTGQASEGSYAESAPDGKEPMHTDGQADGMHAVPEADPQNRHEASKPRLPLLAQDNGVFDDWGRERLHEVILSAAIYDEAMFSFFGPKALAAVEALTSFLKFKSEGNTLSFDAVSYNCKSVPYTEQAFHEAIRRVERGIKAAEFHFFGRLEDGSLTKHSSEAAARFHANPKQVEAIIIEVIQFVPVLWNKRADAGQMERRAREASNEMEAALKKSAASVPGAQVDGRPTQRRTTRIDLPRRIPRPAA